jgi:hypothetical protein
MFFLVLPAVSSLLESFETFSDTESPGPGGCDCQKVSVPSKYEKKTRTWMICVKGTFSSQESGKEMQRATRLESVHHSQETEIMHYYYSILHDPASSILEKRTLQGHKLRHPQVLIWTDGRKQLGCSSTCESTSY